MGVAGSGQGKPSLCECSDLPSEMDSDRDGRLGMPVYLGNSHLRCDNCDASLQWNRVLLLRKLLMATLKSRCVIACDRHVAGEETRLGVVIIEGGFRTTCPPGERRVVVHIN